MNTNIQRNSLGWTNTDNIVQIIFGMRIETVDRKGWLAFLLGDNTPLCPG